MSEDDLIEASPCKLRNGNWGCKTQEPVAVGDTVRIVTRAKKQWRAQVSQIVWTDDQVCICETVSENSAGSSSQSSASGQDSARPSRAPRSTDEPAETNPADYAGTPAYSADRHPTSDNAPSEDLDAMADRAAEQDDEIDDLMNAMQEAERDRS